MPNKPDDINQLPVTPISPDSVETQSIGVVQKTQEEIIVLLQQENAQFKEDIFALIQELNRDTLTGLPNRKYITEWMLKKINENTQFVFFFIDLNKFKDLNDRLGHDKGDIALIIYARTLMKLILKNPNLAAARLSGDEFVVICLEKNVIEGLDIAYELQNLLVEELKDSEFSYTASIGIAGSEQRIDYIDNFKQKPAEDLLPEYISKTWKMGDEANTRAKTTDDGIWIWDFSCSANRLLSKEDQGYVNQLDSVVRGIKKSNIDEVFNVIIPNILSSRKKHLIKE